MPSDNSKARKALVWIGSSKRDLLAMPAAMRKDFGFALDFAQQGLRPEGAKQLKGKVAGTTQLSEDYQGDTYRAVYTVEMEKCVYVLHCFQKKSKKGSETPKPDLDLIEARLKAARDLHADAKGKTDD
jgi:phage-related protein